MSCARVVVDGVQMIVCTRAKPARIHFRTGAIAGELTACGRPPKDTDTPDPERVTCRRCWHNLKARR